MKTLSGRWALLGWLTEKMAVLRPTFDASDRDLPLIAAVWLVCPSLYLAMISPIGLADVIVYACAVVCPLCLLLTRPHERVLTRQAVILGIFLNSVWITYSHPDTSGIWHLVPALVAVQFGGRYSCVFWSAISLGLAFFRFVPAFTPGAQRLPKSPSLQDLAAELVAWSGVVLTVLILDAARARRVRRLEREVALFSELAYRDELTGAYSRRYITNYAEKAHHKAARHAGVFSLFLVDIDHFKRINDTYGHATGDQVLQQVVSVLSGCLEREATVGRFGGEEFLVVLPGDGLHEAVMKAERVRDSVQQLHADSLPPTVQLTVSIGVVTFQQHESLLQLIARADSALYLAKSTGRNKVVSAGSGALLSADSTAAQATDDAERRSFRCLATLSDDGGARLVDARAAGRK